MFYTILLCKYILFVNEDVVHGIVFMEYFVLQLLLIWIRKLWMSGTSFSVLFRWSFQFFFISLKFVIIDDKKPFSSKNTTKETMLILKILCSTLTKDCTRTQQTLENTERAIRNGQSRETGNIEYTGHKSRTTNIREYRTSNQKWTIQRNWQHRVHRTQVEDNKH